MKKYWFLAALALLSGACKQQEVRLDFPVAEWDKAGVILMIPRGTNSSTA